MKKEQIHNLIDHILALESLSGKDNMPYVSMEVSTSRSAIEVRVKDRGIDAAGPYDGVYTMDINYDCKRVLDNCLSHLVDLEIELESRD